MPNSTVDENFEFYGDEHPNGNQPPLAEEYITPRTPIMMESTAERSPVTTPQMPPSKSSKRKMKKSAMPVLQPPEGLTTREVRNAEDLATYVESALNSISPNKTGMYMTVKNMSYMVPSKKGEMKTILHDMSFYLKPGMMCLVLGSPGGGRTSLFKVLANATPKHSVVEGEVLFNNRPIDPKTHHLDISYITQADNHLPLLTVRETLWFSSQCNLQPNIPDEMREHRLETLLNILGLKKVENTYLGNEFVRGVSGGQKKRVTIGVDMLKGGNIYFLDEPTTGLDSVTSFEVLNCVKSLTTHGKCGVMCALLQPPREVFDLFDQVLILNEGRISYFGPTQGAVPYFERRGFFPPEGMNPAEFLQEIVNVPEDFSREHPPQLVTAADFAEEYKASPEYEETMRIVSNPTEELLPGYQLVDHVSAPSHVNGFWQQLKLCMWRSAKITVRNRAPIIARNIKITLIAIILGTAFLNLDNDQSSIAQREGVLYFSMLTFVFASLITIRDLYDQRPILYEQRNFRKWYTTLPYFISYITPEFILGGIETALFTMTLYWLADLRTGAARVVYFMLDLYLMEIFGCSLITLVAALTPSSMYASTLVPSLLLLLILASGFLVAGPLIPGWWIWLFWASPLKWAYEGLVINEMAGMSFRCTPSQAYPSPRVPDIAQFGGQTVCAVTSGTQVLNGFGFDSRLWYRWIDLAIVAGFSFGLLSVAYFVLKVKDQQPRSGPAVTQASPRTKHLRSSKRKTLQQTETSVEVVERNPGLEITGTYLSFKNLSYFVPAPKATKKEAPPAGPATDAQGKMKTNEAGAHELQLLYHITGYVKPGCLTALMGPSGAGKSTLLDVLAARKNVGRITGDILINGKQRDKFFTRYTAYVTQSDILFPTSTVREAVTFSAMCRLPQALSKVTKLTFANQVLDGLRLNEIANKVIGTGQSGLSLEQRKRVNIAVELAANPQMIFLDEPTSGLDSAGARKVMKLTKRLAQQGRTIVCTIHQPSAEIFKFFDNLLLLSPGGKTVYFGPIGENGSHFVEYCSRLGYYMEEGKNLADFVLEFATATSHDQTDMSVIEANTIIERQHAECTGGCDKIDDAHTVGNLGESQSFYTSGIYGPYCPIGDEYHMGTRARREPPRTLEQLVENYNSSQMQANAVQEVENPEFVPAGFQAPQFNTAYASSFVTQLKENLNRSLKAMILRRRVEFIFQVIRTLVLGVFLGTIFITLGLDQDGIRSRVAHIFFSCTFAGFIGFALIPAVVQERGVFYHEQSSGTYKPAAYGLALVIATIPLIVATTISYTFPAWWIPNMDPSHNFPRFLFFLMVFFLATLAIVCMAELLAVAMPTEGIAVMFLGIIVPIFTLFAGFLLPRTSIPGWWIWAYWISLLHYAVEAIVIELFSSLLFHCTAGQQVLINGIEYCPVTSGKQIVSQYGYISVWKWIDVGVVAATYGIFVILICLALAKIRHAKT